MFAYGKGDRPSSGSGQESLLYGLNLTVRGIINSFPPHAGTGLPRTLPVPGLESLANLATMVMKGGRPPYLDKGHLLLQPVRDRIADAWDRGAGGAGLLWAGMPRPILKDFGVGSSVLDRGP